MMPILTAEYEDEAVQTRTHGVAAPARLVHLNVVRLGFESAGHLYVQWTRLAKF